MRILFPSLLLILLASSSFSQSIVDKELLLNSCNNSKYAEKSITYTFSQRHKVTNFLVKPLLFVYQKFLSKQISAECLYHTSCSEYSKLLYKRYGFTKATLSTIDRLMRCDRLSELDIKAIDRDKKTGKKIETTNYYLFHSK